MTIDRLLADGQEYVWRPTVALLSVHLTQPERDVELMLVGIVSTCVALFFLNLVIGSLFGSRQSTAYSVCCVTKFFEQRRAKRAGIVTIPAGSGGQQGEGGAVGAFMQELYGQLASIQKELSILKHERELMDAELIETSTQILQTLGAPFIGAFPGDESLISRDGSMGTTPESTRRKIELPTPVIHKPQVVRPDPIVPQPKSPKHTNVEPMHNVVPIVVAAPKAFPKQDISPVNAPVHAPIKPQPVQPTMNQPETKPQATVPVASKAEPKMSALAAARMKREAEVNAAKSAPTATVPQPTATAKNPFAAHPKAGSIPSGPFQR